MSPLFSASNYPLMWTTICVMHMMIANRPLAPNSLVVGVKIYCPVRMGCFCGIAFRPIASNRCSRAPHISAPSTIARPCTQLHITSLRNHLPACIPGEVESKAATPFASLPPPGCKDLQLLKNPRTVKLCQIQLATAATSHPNYGERLRSPSCLHVLHLAPFVSFELPCVSPTPQYLLIASQSLESRKSLGCSGSSPNSNSVDLLLTQLHAACLAVAQYPNKPTN